MNETEFLANVVELAKTLGYIVHHDRPAQTTGGSWITAIQGDPGFPDLVLAKPGRLIFAELKSDAGVVGASQWHWLDTLRTEHGCEVYVWRPRDIQTIAEVLGPRGSDG